MTSSGQAGTNTEYIIFLSVASAIGGILFGYDTAVISGTIRPQKKKRTRRS